MNAHQKSCLKEVFLIGQCDKYYLVKNLKDIGEELIPKWAKLDGAIVWNFESSKIRKKKVVGKSKG
jgi:hypothetical protein